MKLRILWLALATGACGPPHPGPWIEGDGHRWRELHPRGDGGFTRLDAPNRGVTFRYEVPEEVRVQNRVLAEGQGVAIGDVDSDGRPDLFFAGFGGPSALFRNVGGWRFEDITSSAGLELRDTMARGAAFVDLDGDRDLDLVVTVHGATNRIFLGNGKGGFEAFSDAGLSGSGASTTPALADVDKDGDLDLYITNYKTRQVDDLYEPDILDINLLQPGPDGELMIPEGLRALYAEHYRVEFDGRFVRRFELGEPDELYLNEGGGRFRPIPLETALAGPGARDRGPARDWGLAARFSDWDDDGDPDLYVANDFNSPDGIWLNDGTGSFVAAPSETVRTTSLSSMAIEVGDLDRDGDLDLITTDMLARDLTERLTQTSNFEAPPEPPGVTDTRIQVNRNTVQLNRGDGTFAEAAWELGLAASDWTWGALLLDADLDGWDDLLVTTGHVWDQLNGDIGARVSAARLPADQALRMFPELRQPNVAFRGGPGGFTDVGDAWGWGRDADISHGIAAGDLDADGDLDVVVTRFSDPPILYRNEAAAPRVLVRLRGAAPNNDGIGARVRLLGHAVGAQIREIVAGGSYLSSSEPVASFAAATSEMTIVVDWPDGAQTRLDGVIGNREYEVYHSAAGVRSAAPPPPAPHFVDLSEALAHRHVESPFDDRQRQPLLPHSLDRLGPGVSWADVDADGDADLLIGSGRGGSPVLLRNEGGIFASARAVTPALDLDATAILPHEMNGGRAGLVIGISGYEARSAEEANTAPRAVSVALGRGSGAGAARDLVASAGPEGGPPSATGPVAQADIDGDGDLDVFLGGRVSPTFYPRAADSWILDNDAGDLTANRELSRPFWGLGMVSAAVFTDYDVDGDPDLALALEWGPIRLFVNEDGRFRDVSDSLGLGDLAGRWNGISTGDFNEDGRPDLVATGWGANLDVPASYALLYGDMNRDGLFDVVEARRGSGGWRPIRGRDALARPIPDPVPGLPSLLSVPYSTFAATPLDSMIGGLDARVRLEARELRHTVLLNLGSGFQATPLPPEAQRAPAFGVAVGDLDGDGHEDLVLSQNFYAGRPGVPRYDAGRGLWLRGDGRGSFEAVPGARSGIAVYGDGRGVGLADYDRDGRVDLAIGVNGGLTRLYRNTGAAPGLRVILDGGSGNRSAVGARLRVEYEDGSLGPAREVTSGEGYWSRNEAVQTLGLASSPQTLHVTWPGGAQTTTPIGPERVVTVSRQD